MHESVIRGFQVLYHTVRLLLSENNLANKWWVRPVPAAAVIPAPQVAITIIGSKASVAGLVSFL